MLAYLSEDQLRLQIAGKIIPVRIIDGKKATKEYLPPQPGDVERTYADVTKAINELGYKPRTTIERGLAEFVKWLRQDK